MKDLAIAISVYDKFDDVKILVDLIRKNWPGKYHIIVCSSHSNPHAALKGEDIDEIIETEPIPYNPQIHKKDVQKRLHIFMRVIDSIRKGCQRGALSGASYTLHIHADAVPLSWDAIASLLKTMKSEQKKFIGLGKGFGFYTCDSPVGSLDDMFFFVDNDFARETSFWKFDLYDYLPHKISVHGWLAILVMAKVGLRHFKLLANWDELLHWDGRVVDKSPLNSSIPMYFHPRYKFLHVHESAFTKNFGLHLKAYYLNKYGITCGSHIEDFLKNWLLDERDLFQRLKVEEKRLMTFFKKRGLSRIANCSWGRVFSKWDERIHEYESLKVIEKVRWLVRQHWVQIKREIQTKMFYKVFLGSSRYLLYYPDIVWPQPLKPIYDDNVLMDTTLVPELHQFPFD